MTIANNSDWLFHGPSGTTNPDIIRWWEWRRLTFNVWVGLVGIVSWVLVLVAGGASVKPGVDFVEPLGMLFGPILYAILANICYTFGWIVDVVTYNNGPRKALFKIGFIFSLILTALPGPWAVTAYLITLHTAHKLD